MTEPTATTSLPASESGAVAPGKLVLTVTVVLAAPLAGAEASEDLPAAEADALIYAAADAVWQALWEVSDRGTDFQVAAAGSDGAVRYGFSK